ncbi:DUF5667 domain-containing protein [Nonomuraea longicatena]|uniref:DUF5667 domain-containing protein n=1 Tax=Nonomuraea longicatena TaxID=83682 RepID=A0ABP4BPC1_9ACTN
MGRSRPGRRPFGATRRSQERVLDQLEELREQPLRGGPSTDFRADLRERLLRAEAAEAAEAAEEPQDSRVERRRRRHAGPVRLPWVSQLVTVGLTAAMVSMAYLTYQAVPGDTLYPLKRAAESTLVRLSSDEVERGERELVSARERASEVSELLNSTGKGPLVSSTLKEMDRSTRSAIERLERAQPRSPRLNRFAEDQRDLVEPLLERLDGPEQDQANTYLHYIDGLAAPR